MAPKAPKKKSSAKAAARSAKAGPPAAPVGHAHVPVVVPIAAPTGERLNAVHFKKIRDKTATILQHEVFTGVESANPLPISGDASNSGCEASRMSSIQILPGLKAVAAKLSKKDSRLLKIFK